MDLFEYISFAKPDEAYKIFREYSEIRVGSSAQLAVGLREVMKNLPMDSKEDFLMKIAAIHPDAELLSSLSPSPYPDNSDMYINRHNQGMTSYLLGPTANASGTNAVNHYMSSGDVQQIIDSKTNGLTQELDTMKTSSKMSKEVNDKIFKLVATGVILYIAYKLFTK